MARRVAVNSASASDLRQLDGIGPVLAERIIDNRPYYSATELLRVNGIGPKRLAAIVNFISFASVGQIKESNDEEETEEVAVELVDINTATTTQLMTLKGVGPAIAQRIIAARPFGHVSQLLSVHGIGPKVMQKLEHELKPIHADPPPAAGSEPSTSHEPMRSARVPWNLTSNVRKTVCDEARRGTSGSADPSTMMLVATWNIRNLSR